jgi:hypothetical protein
MIYVPRQMLLGYIISDNELGWSCGADGGRREMLAGF